MNLTLVEQITKKQLKSDIPVFKAGDTLKVYVKIKEGNKYRQVHRIFTHIAPADSHWVIQIFIQPSG